MTILTVGDISTSYGSKRVLNNVSFSAESGEIIGILGENGSGKSTLIKSVCNILAHTGSCFCKQEQLEKLSSKKLAQLCSYVPQKSGLEIEMSVLDVLLMGFNAQLGLFENPRANMICKAKEQLEEFGFAEKMYDDFTSLSEGQKQLCILMRAMMTNCSVLLMDEPENALDITMRNQMMQKLKSWVGQEERAIIVALHDISLALNYCDRILLIKDGTNVGIVNPKSDSLEEMEEALTRLYGRICLRRVEDNQGRVHLVLLKESEV